MADVIGGMRQAVQNLVTPDLKGHAAKFYALQTQMELQHVAMMKTIEAFRAEMRSEFTASRASYQLELHRQLSPIREGSRFLKSGTGKLSRV